MIVVSTSACGSRNSASDKREGQGDWIQVAPTELKNSVELFNTDWMALAVGHEEDMNAMTISWGELGELWQRPVMTVFVSPTRYTHSFMERNKYFTLAAFPQQYHTALEYIGSHSGRDSDKLTEAGLTVSFTELGNPFFNEANLVIECKILYSTQFDSAQMPDEIKEIYATGRMEPHTMYIGEIVNVWKR